MSNVEAARVAVQGLLPGGMTKDNPATSASRRYLLLSACFQYPDQDLVDAIAAGDLDGLLGDNVRQIDDVETLQVEYTRLFDVISGSSSLCSLNAGDYGDGRPQKLEEMVRFYAHFGLTLPQQYPVLPDHLTAQLEFLHFLSHEEARLLAEAEDPADYRRAQRDFLRRLLLPWLPDLIAKLARHRAATIFQDLTAGLVMTVENEMERLDRELAHEP